MLALGSLALALAVPAQAHGADATVTYLADFNAQTGGAPRAGLMRASDGNFYGVTPGGGKFGMGSIYRLTPDGVLKVLHSFRSQKAGFGATTPLVQASDGNLYGTAAGGKKGCGLVFRISLAGDYEVFHAFGCDKHGADPESALIQSRGDGDLYGMTAGGGLSNRGLVYRLSLAGEFTVLGFFKTATGGAPYGALLEGDDGNFYGTTTSWGAHSGGTVFRISPTGGIKSLYDFAPPMAATGSLIYSASHDKMLGTGFNKVFEYSHKQVVISSTTGVLTPLTLGPDGRTYYAFARIGTDGWFVSLTQSYEETLEAPLGGQAQVTSAPTLASDGSLWGATIAGGLAGTGQLFEITLD
jgi:uncharacterized repeat protein (TIGR03803 family)